MQRYAEMFIDHFGWCTADEEKTIEIFEKLGFHMGDKRPDTEEPGSFWMSHFYMDEDSAYINIYPQDPEGNMWPIKLDWIQQPGMPLRERLSDPRGVTGVYTYVLSTGDCDASNGAAPSAGYDVCKVYRREMVGTELPYYAKLGGSVTSDMFAFDLGLEPFPNMMIGVMEHTDENHAHAERKNIHEYHANGVTQISALVLYYETEEMLMGALKAIHQLHDTLKEHADAGCYTSCVRLIDKNAYEREFDVQAPKGIRSNVVGVEFKHGDLDYIREAAEKNGYTWFEKNGRIYVDGRDALNAYLIFA